MMRLLKNGPSMGNLDFKAVILYGTSKLRGFLKKPCDYIENIDELKLQSKNAKRKYLSTLRNLYVACSRAREILIVLEQMKQPGLVEMWELACLKQELFYLLFRLSDFH